jgi:hypothetical protein
MKLLSFTGEQFEFELNHEEHALLFHVLQQYPLVPATHYRLSQTAEIPHAKENQRLLEESLQTHRAAHQQLVQVFLRDAGRFVAVAAGQRVMFTRTEIEWLLQVVNDVRVGSWLALGSPDAAAENRRPTKKTAPHLMNMEVAGFFEMNFINALTGDE